MKGRKPPRAQHSSESAEWGTGRAFVDIARATLGKISVDPFSSAEWNRSIGAERIITAKQDGFATQWVPHGPDPEQQPTMWEAPPDIRERAETAFVNHPGDKSGENSKRAWHALVNYRDTGWLAGGAIWVAFSLNQFQTLQRAGTERTLCDPEWLRCIPAGREAYESSPGVVGAQPTHPSALVLLPALDQMLAGKQRSIFRLLGGRIGAVF